MEKHYICTVKKCTYSAKDILLRRRGGHLKTKT